MEAEAAQGTGKRGRPTGSSNTRLAKDTIYAAKQTGLLPHEILLDMARGNPQKVRKVASDKDGEPVVEESWVTVSVEEQRDAAKAAAPYYAPKISTVEVITGVSDDDLDSIIARLAAEAGFGDGLGGEGKEEEAPSPAQSGRNRRRLEL